MRRLGRCLPSVASAATSSRRHLGLGWFGKKNKRSTPADQAAGVDPAAAENAAPLTDEEASAFSKLRKASAANFSSRDTGSNSSSSSGGFFPSFVTYGSSSSASASSSSAEGGSDSAERPATPSRAVDEITVMNLPDAGSGNPAQEYTRKTSVFLSKAETNVVMGTGMMSGFSDGMGPYKGRLPPSMVTRSPFMTVPKTEAETAIIHEAIDRNHYQITKMHKIKREAEQARLAIAKKVRGSTGYSVKEHSLFADLDFDRDWVLLGTNPEDFEKNLVRLQKLVTQYRKWERKDNRYYYGVLLLRALVALTIIDITNWTYQIYALQAGFDDFQQSVEDSIANMVARRQADMAMALVDLQANPPDFAPVVAALLKERQAKAEVAAAPAAGAAVVDAYKPQFDKLGRIVNHPMDTSFVEQTRIASEDEQRTRQLSLLATSVRDDQTKMLPSWSLTRAIQGLFTGDKNSKSGSGQATAAAPLLSSDDVASFSYAVAPTSIESARGIRRILLPRNDDMVTVVQESMLRYKAEKFAALNFPE